MRLNVILKYGMYCFWSIKQAMQHCSFSVAGDARYNNLSFILEGCLEMPRQWNPLRFHRFGRPLNLCRVYLLPSSGIQSTCHFLVNRMSCAVASLQGCPQWFSPPATPAFVYSLFTMNRAIVPKSRSWKFLPYFLRGCELPCYKDTQVALRRDPCDEELGFSVYS